ncbi:hypothetical protein ACJIZ3_023394 [Penstemon smallii]|uniref:Transmembrane protein n=1 Tax=Penstemon smallii TaxID=265156 RepID=A0ABD3TRV9_9LAMI
MATLSSSISHFHLSTSISNPWHQNSSFSSGFLLKSAKIYSQKQKIIKLRVMAVKEEEEGSDENTPVPSWAKPDSDELPPWARQEAQKDSSNSEIPFFVYLLASAITAIAAIGSVFEYVNQKPVFGVLDSDSVFYAPVLGFFAFTGIPSSAYLWFKSVQVANKEAEEQDRKDGYL